MNIKEINKITPLFILYSSINFISPNFFVVISLCASKGLPEDETRLRLSQTECKAR